MLLAFDTSSPTVTVAVHDGDDVVAEAASTTAMRHGEELTPLVDDVLRRAGVGPRDLGAVAVGVGPGPFTGLRVGLVTARTLAHVLAIPAYGVCSLDVLAVEAVGVGAVEGAFVVATDARRKEVYVASYEGPRRTAGPEVLRPADAATDLPAVGEGVRLYPDQFPAGRPPLRPSAGWLARALVAEAVELHDPEPMYLRRPDAVTPGAPKPVS